MSRSSVKTSDNSELPDAATMIKASTVDEISKAGPGHYVVLDDGETYTGAMDAVIIDHFGTVYDLMQVMDGFIKNSPSEEIEKAMIAKMPPAPPPS